MSILSNIFDDYCWQQLLKSKKEGGHLSSYEEKQYIQFIDSKAYLPVAEKILVGNAFPLPEVVELNKKHSNKKRTVFIFNQEENYVLKLIAYLLNKYDYIFPSNLYSFRKNMCVKNAISDIIEATREKSLFTYKVDIHDYFNSVDTSEIIQLLNHYLSDDIETRKFIQAILLEPRSLKNGEIVYCKKGIMAGVPISGFLANLYLMDLDRWFENQGITYARYSDDIIVFAETSEEIANYENVIKEFLSKKKLEINPQKEVRTSPGESWEFLGFCIKDQGVDISKIALEKIKDKMRRKAKALVRWKKRNNTSNERAIKAFIRHFNIKIYENPKQNDITWCRWYFPTITTSESLHLIDEYMLSCIRYIATGKHTKANYNLKYETIKEMGYISLVNSFYKYKKTNEFVYSASK